MKVKKLHWSRICGIGIALISLFLHLSVHGSLPQKKTSSEITSLKFILDKYKNSKGTSADVERVLVQSLQGRTLKTSGRVLLAGPLFRIDLSGVEKTIILFDGKKLWSETVKDGEINPQVTKMSIGPKAENQMLLNEIFARGKLLERFNVLRVNKIGEELVFELEPNKDVLSIQSLRLTVDSKKKLVVGFVYTDELENQTEYKFRNQKFNLRIESHKFKYVPPKGAVVNEL